jgi:hypothetical protein
MKVKVLSLWEPWASAMARELKKNETRHWPLFRFGTYAIHAAKQKFIPSKWDDGFVAQVRRDGLMDKPFPYGCVVCFVDFTGSPKTTTIRDSQSPTELAYGNYEDFSDVYGEMKQRYAFTSQNLRTLPTPYPLTGRQGIFEWELPSELLPLVASKEEQGLFA